MISPFVNSQKLKNCHNISAPPFSITDVPHHNHKWPSDINIRVPLVLASQSPFAPPLTTPATRALLTTAAALTGMVQVTRETGPNSWAHTFTEITH